MLDRNLYFVLMAMIGVACVFLGWDSENAVILYQVAILIGGAVIGHVLTEVLNESNQPEE